MMFCPDCNTNLGDVPVEGPCPKCGGRRRDANAAAATAKVRFTAHASGVSIIRGDHPAWTDQRVRVLNCLEALRAVYRSDARSLGNAEVDRRVETFFVECDHFRDRLKKNLDALPNVTEDDVDDHAWSSQALRTCNAICNTHKHHRRDRGSTTARIRETSMLPTGSRVTIEVDWASASAARVDGLELAEDCVKSWREFFAEFGIAGP